MVFILGTELRLILTGTDASINIILMEAFFMDRAKIAVVGVMMVLLISLIIMGPIFTIWSLNTVFELKIPINFNSWASVIWLMTVFHGIRFQINKN